MLSGSVFRQQVLHALQTDPQSGQIMQGRGNCRLQDSADSQQDQYGIDSNNLPVIMPDTPNQSIAEEF